MELHWDIYNREPEAQVILLAGATLGGNSAHQWTAVAEKLRRAVNVVFVDLPGHSLSPHWPDDEDPSLDALAAGIMKVVRAVRDELGNKPVIYAGISISGATGLHLARDYSDELDGVAVLASAATVGAPTAWRERAALVEREGTHPLLEETEKRWFTSEFRAARRDVVEIIMEGLAATNDHSYAQLCKALAVHDVRNDLQDIRLPLLLIAGERDSSTPIANVELVAETVPGAELKVIADVAHQVTVAAPGDVATLLLNFIERATTPRRREQNDD